MKSTGVVRRIDDLGRIVIPKEIRKTMHIKNGESLEIFSEDDNIILKKYSDFEDLSYFYNIYVNLINNLLKKDVLITDRNKVMACAGITKKEYLNMDLSPLMDDVFNNRKIIYSKDIVSYSLVMEKVDRISYIVAPIIISGDIAGSMIVISRDSCVTDNDIRIADITSNFISKYIEL